MKRMMNSGKKRKKETLMGMSVTCDFVGSVNQSTIEMRLVLFNPLCQNGRSGDIYW
jgi:hypothetical protein